MSQKGTFCNLWKLIGPEVALPYVIGFVLLIILACSIAIFICEIVLSQKIGLGLSTVFCRNKKVNAVKNLRCTPKIIIIRSKHHPRRAESRPKNVSPESRPNNSDTAFVNMAPPEMKTQPPRTNTKEPTDMDMMKRVFEEMIVESKKDILKKMFILTKSNKTLVFVMLSLMLSVAIHMGTVLIDGVLRAHDYANLYKALKSANYDSAALCKLNTSCSEDITNSP